MTKDDFVRFLRTTLKAVEENDSAEGRIQYEWGSTPGTFNVDAFVRVGNSRGQGGCIMVREVLSTDGHGQ